MGSQWSLLIVHIWTLSPMYNFNFSHPNWTMIDAQQRAPFTGVQLVQFNVANQIFNQMSTMSSNYPIKETFMKFYSWFVIIGRNQAKNWEISKTCSLMICGINGTLFWNSPNLSAYCIDRNWMLNPKVLETEFIFK